MHRQGMVSIWFFIGALLLVYGILIMGAGLYEYSSPPKTIVHSELHASVWWGGLLIVLGLLYSIRFSPWRSK